MLRSNESITPSRIADTLNYQQTFKPCVLLIEDEPIIQKLHRMMLEKIGYEVDVASSGQQALALYQSAKYTAVLLDAGLPDMTGFDVAKIIRERDTAQQHQHLIMLSAFTYDEIKAQCELANIDSFAIKPVFQEKLNELLRCQASKIDSHH